MNTEQALNVELLRAELVALKLKAKPKRWQDRPEGPVECGGYVFTCCYENFDLVVGVSPRIKGGDPVYEVVVSVFGNPDQTWQTSYPKRGETTLLTWRRKL